MTRWAYTLPLALAGADEACLDGFAAVVGKTPLLRLGG